MGVFGSRRLPTSPASSVGKLAARYRAALPHHPFLLFGLPFISLMVAGSFFLTPVTAVRFEQQDRKTRTVSTEEAQELAEQFEGLRMKPTDVREEYFRLASKSTDDWEPKRVDRLPGEPDGIL